MWTSSKVALPLVLFATAVPCRAAAVQRETTLESRTSGLINAAEYGAKGDGVTDDTLALQAAIDAAKAAKATLLLPAGSFRVGTLRLGSASDVRIVGTGTGTVLSAKGLAGPVLSISASQRVTIQDLAISGSFAQGVAVSSSSFLRFARLDIQGATLAGSIGTGGIVLQDVSDCWVEDCHLHGNGRGAPGDHSDIGTYGGSTANTRLTIKGNRCVSTLVNHNIGLFNTSKSEISENYVTGAMLTFGTKTTGGYGIMLYKTASAVEWGANVVRGNVVEATHGTGIYVQTQPGTTVTGNTIRDAAKSQVDTALSVGGVGVLGGGVSVVGNSIEASGMSGISVVGPGNTVSANRITGPMGRAGILVRSGTFTTVSGNTVMSTSAPGIANWDFVNGTRTDIASSNIYSANSVTGASGGAPGIGVRNEVGSVITGNTCFSNGGHGIWLVDMNRAVVLGNVATENSQSGVAAASGIALSRCQWTTVKANQCSGARHKYGIDEQTASNNNEITDNQMTTWATAPIASTGPASITRGNRFSAGSSTGLVTLSTGFPAANVSTAEVQAGDKIRLSRQAAAGTPGHLSVGSITPRAGFTIISSSGDDKSTVEWEIVH